MPDLSGLDCVRLQAPDGACAIVTRFGAQVVSWIPVDDGERIFLSDRTATDGCSPIRGGVPVVFPQFATCGPLPHHGLVHTRNWRIDEIREREAGAAAAFRIEDDGETRGLWPHAFACVLTVSVSGSRLDLQLQIENTGSTAFEFSAALHTYLSIADIETVRLEGLHASLYRDRVDRDRKSIDRDEVLTISGEVDRVYADAPRYLVLREPSRSLHVHSEGFTDVVVWNPWKDKCRTLPDLSDDAYRRMLCVEAAAVVRPPRLEPRAAWTGSQSLQAMPLGLRPPHLTRRRPASGDLSAKS
jgi:glucose-6-phosphate 1-epimerase